MFDLDTQSITEGVFFCNNFRKKMRTLFL